MFLSVIHMSHAIAYLSRDASYFIFLHKFLRFYKFNVQILYFTLFNVTIFLLM